jgi:hypothetical protein
MTTESNSSRRYHVKEGLLFLSSIALFLSPYINLRNPLTIKIKELLEIPVEISDSLPAIALFYFTTIALAFYVFVEWCRLDKAERKSLQRWTVYAFEGFAIFVLYWRYADLFKNSAYGRFSPLWFFPFIVLGYLSGLALAMFRFAFSLRRTRDEAKRKHLPRTPRQAKEMITGNIRIVLFVVVPGLIASFYFYPGPTRWVPAVLYLLSIIPRLSAYSGLFVKRPDGTRPLDRLKMITDWADQNDTLARCAKNNPSQQCHEELLRQHLPAKNLQRIASKRVKEVEQLNYSKVSPRFLGEIPDSEPEMYVFELQDSKGKHLVQVEKSIAEKWRVEYVRLQKESGKNINEKELDGLSAKWASYAVDDMVLRACGSSLLMNHLQLKIEEDLELIISVDPDLNEQFGGYTPLLQAVADGFLPGVKLLLKHGADMEIANNLGATPFLFAARYDNADLLCLLKNAGANIHATDANGEDALMKAAQMNCKSVAPLLIQWGLDVRRKNLGGCNALQMATLTKSGEIAILIRRKMRGLSVGVVKRKGRKKRKH